MVIFGRLVFYLFGRLVNNSAIQFSIFSAIWIRPYVEVRSVLFEEKLLFFVLRKGWQHCNINHKTWGVSFFSTICV